MDASEIVRCVLQIENSRAERSYGNIVTLLSDLDQLHITAEQLETTDIVKVLYRLLKSCPDDVVKKTAKSLLSKWKRQYSEDLRRVKSTEDREDPRLSCRVAVHHEAADGGLSKEGDSHQTCDSKVENEKACTSSTVTNDGLQTVPSTTEKTSAPSDFQSIRAKCVQLLLAAFCPESAADKAAELAEDIEQHIHELHRASHIRYKACVRSKVANLRNPKNDHLRQGLLSGSLSPEAFARMSAEEMASAELRQLRETYSSQGVSERQLPQSVEGTHTQKIRCKKCGGSDCRVTQVSRGALFLPAWVRQGGPDDDAMTFVTCSGCGQQWYHTAWVTL